MREILYKHNKHWNDSKIKTGVTRSGLANIINALPAKHIQAISGVRRSGKSYLLRQVSAHLIQNGIPVSNILNINFEDPFFISKSNSYDVLDNIYTEFLTLKNPQGRIFIFFDEIQNIKNWQYWIRDIYDRVENIKFFITGSNADLLSVELNTHLTGRVLVQENFPFSFAEYLSSQGILYNDSSINNNALIYENNFSKKEELLHYLEKSFITGFFPEITTLDNQELISDILNQYFENIIFKDIIPRFAIRNTKVVEQLAYYLSSNFTSLFSYLKTAEIVGSNENSVKEYLSYFEKAYLFFSLEHYDFSLGKQFRKPKKVYMIDCGMRNATAFKFSEDYGRIAENNVYLYLRRLTKKIYYFQGDHNKEIDFIISTKAGLLGINVCYSDEIPEREFGAFTCATSKKIDFIRRIIVTRNTFATSEHDNIKIEAIPLWCFLLTQL